MICRTCLAFDFPCLSLSAESEGFEPPVQLPVHRISSAAHSTTLAAFLFYKGCVGNKEFLHTPRLFFYFFFKM